MHAPRRVFPTADADLTDVLGLSRTDSAISACLVHNSVLNTSLMKMTGFSRHHLITSLISTDIINVSGCKGFHYHMNKCKLLLHKDSNKDNNCFRNRNFPIPVYTCNNIPFHIACSNANNRAGIPHNYDYVRASILLLFQPTLKIVRISKR